jgi:riboflavin kinase/FMN adenylyltransferase
MIVAAMSRQEASSIAKGGVLALGNFDGVHRGHQAVIKAAIDKARGLGVPARVLTLEPHPRSVLKPEVGPFRLTPAATKLRLLKQYGVDDVIIQTFSPDFSTIEAAEFANRFLVQDFGARHVVAGFDFVFGHKRAGNMDLLRTWLSAHGIGVTEVTPFRDSTGEVMSSSRTRELLQKGDTATAEHILGRPWSITGKVEHGAQRGASLGFPTANIGLGEHLRPKIGVYAVTVGYPGELALYKGVANIGVRPTVDGKTELLEVHLFDFRGDLYGKELEVNLMRFLRPEQTFDNLESLREQIKQDVQNAKSYLMAVE